MQFAPKMCTERLSIKLLYDDYMLVKLKYIDFAFKIKYSTHGYMEKYTTVIESCEIVSF